MSTTTFKGKPVETWADGFGLWHAKVPLERTEDIDEHWPAIRAAARRAIRKELTERGDGTVFRLDVQHQPASAAFTSVLFKERA